MVRQLIAFLLLSCTHAAILRGADSDRMRPEVVASSLVHVEDEWRKLAAVFTEASSSATSSAKAAPGAFDKSCATVVSAVVQGSGGDRDVAKEYMSNVCSQTVLSSWHKLRCTALASRITDHAMLADNYANRQNLNPKKVCTGFWSVFVEAERNREAEEAKERAEQDKIRAEEEKKQAAVAAEAKTKAEAEAKVVAANLAKEAAIRAQAEKEQLAKKQAAEAKVRAAQAAAHLAEKRAEAEKVQKEAQQKLAEAEEAEKEHQERLADHQKAEAQLRNATATKETADSTMASNSTKVAEPAPAVPRLAPKAAPKEIVIKADTKPVSKPVEIAKSAAAPQKVDVVTAAKPAAVSAAAGALKKVAK